MRKSKLVSSEFFSGAGCGRHSGKTKSRLLVLMVKHYELSFSAPLLAPVFRFTGASNISIKRRGCAKLRHIRRRGPSASSSPKQPSQPEIREHASGPAKPDTKSMFVSANVGKEMYGAALKKFGGDRIALAKECGEAVAEAVGQCFEVGRVFGVCGGGLKGLVGAYAMIALKRLGWSGMVWWGERDDTTSGYGTKELLKQEGLELCDFVPGAVEFYFDAVIEALFGLGWDGGAVREEYAEVHRMLCAIRKPVVCIDIPAGWDPDGGPRAIDMERDEFVKPEVLVSLGVPKMAAKRFGGEYHFLGARILEDGWAQTHGVDVPEFPDSASKCVLLKRNPVRFGWEPGEVYGKPGEFLGTLFTKNPRRTWVSDLDDDDDLWDEFE